MTGGSDGQSEQDDSIDPGTIEDFFDGLETLNEAQLLRIASAWDARDQQAHEDAWTQAVARAAVGGLTVEMEDARTAAAAWATRGSNAPWPYGLAMEDTWLQMRRQVGPALADAAVAIFLGDALDEAARRTLLGPWLSAVDDEA